MTSYFERLSPSQFRPTVHAEGAWNDGEIHFSPLGGLIVHAIDTFREARDEAAAQPDSKQLGRVSFDILGFLAAEDVTIDVETIRPGRTIELVEAKVTIAGRTVVLARAWFIQTSDTTLVAGGQPAALPAPESLDTWVMTDNWPGGYVASLEVRALEPPKPGRATVWITTAAGLVAGESSTPHAAYITLVDTANGIAVREPATEWFFPNVDLTIHLYRQPTGAWVGFDTTVIFGREGHGTTSSTLHDINGPVGHSEQMLTVRRARQATPADPTQLTELT